MYDEWLSFLVNDCHLTYHQYTFLNNSDDKCQWCVQWYRYCIVIGISWSKNQGLFQVSCFSADFLDCEKAGKNYMYIGVGRFRILAPRFRILGVGANSQQAHDVVTTSMRRNDVASTSHRRRIDVMCPQSF